MHQMTNFEDSTEPQLSSEMWSEKHIPRTVEGLKIDKQKLQKFKLLMSSTKPSLVLLMGPSGCGKNTLL